MQLTIRAAQEEDFGQIISLFKELAEFEKLPGKMVNSVERMQAEKEFFHCFVAVTPENQLVGYATWFFCYYTWTGKSLYMDDLYVQPAFRGQGLGTQLINTIIRFAKENQCHKLRWQVSEWNQPAIEFYKKLGATVDGTEQNCDLRFD